MISYSTARQVVSSRPSSVLRRDRKRDVGGQRNYSQVYCINFSELWQQRLSQRQRQRSDWWDMQVGRGHPVVLEP